MSFFSTGRKIFDELIVSITFSCSSSKKSDLLYFTKLLICKSYPAIFDMLSCIASSKSNFLNSSDRAVVKLLKILFI